MMQQYLYKPSSTPMMGGGPGGGPAARGVSPSNAGVTEFQHFAETALAAMNRAPSGGVAGLPTPQPPAQQKVPCLAPGAMAVYLCHM